MKGYAADNNPFQSKEWEDDCALKQQKKTIYSGVGAHHQNLSERYIQTIFNWSRALMLHFVVHWPQMAANKSDLWPFAVDFCVHLHNMLPSTSTLLSPYEEVTGTQFDSYEHLTRSHVFGCPVYVLDHRLQDGNKIPKWDKRSRRGVYLASVSIIHPLFI